MVTPRC